MRSTWLMRARRGFSLIEVMVVVAVVGILMATAMPNIASSNKQRRVEAAANDMSGRIQLARQRTCASRIPSRLVLNRYGGTYCFERLSEDATWVRDPDEEYAIPHGVGWSYAVGPDASGDIVEFEGRGTVSLDDAPLSVVFHNDQGDSSFLTLVCTGRVTVR